MKSCDNRGWKKPDEKVTGICLAAFLFIVFCIVLVCMVGRAVSGRTGEKEGADEASYETHWSFLLFVTEEENDKEYGEAILCTVRKSDGEIRLVSIPGKTGGFSADIEVFNESLGLDMRNYVSVNSDTVSQVMNLLTDHDEAMGEEEMKYEAGQKTGIVTEAGALLQGWKEAGSQTQKQVIALVLEGSECHLEELDKASFLLIASKLHLAEKQELFTGDVTELPRILYE